jgi:hypothetical protein
LQSSLPTDRTKESRITDFSDHHLSGDSSVGAPLSTPTAFADIRSSTYPRDSDPLRRPYRVPQLGRAPVADTRRDRRISTQIPPGTSVHVTYTDPSGQSMELTATSGTDGTLRFHPSTFQTTGTSRGSRSSAIGNRSWAASTWPATASALTSRRSTETPRLFGRFRARNPTRRQGVSFPFLSSSLVYRTHEGLTFSDLPLVKPRLLSTRDAEDTTKLRKELAACLERLKKDYNNPNLTELNRILRLMPDDQKQDLLSPKPKRQAPAWDRQDKGRNSDASQATSPIRDNDGSSALSSGTNSSPPLTSADDRAYHNTDRAGNRDDDEDDLEEGDEHDRD